MGPVLRQRVIDGPTKQGLDRANWTYAELADQLYKAKGIRVQKSAMHRFVRGDPVKQVAARADLAALKKKRRRANWSC